jgi:hypothetical protein
MEMTRRGLLGGLAAVGVVGVLAPGDLLASSRAEDAPVVAASNPHEIELMLCYLVTPYSLVRDEFTYSLKQLPRGLLDVKRGDIFVQGYPEPSRDLVENSEGKMLFCVANSDAGPYMTDLHPLNAIIQASEYDDFNEALQMARFEKVMMQRDAYQA